MQKVLTLTLLCVFTGSLFAQTPQAFNYQGVARDVAGNPIANQNIGLRISILQETIVGTIVYRETHQATTSALGLFALQIGTGAVLNGEFEVVDWGKYEHFIQVEMDETGGDNYQLLGTSQLLSVPYALVAQRVGIVQSSNESSVVSQVPINFPLSTSPESAIFNVHTPDTTQYDPDEQHTDGLTIIHKDPRTVGDVCLKLSSMSDETWDANGEFHTVTTVVLNAVSTGRDKSDFTIQNEYASPGVVKETFRIKYNGNVGIDNQDPVSKLQVSNGDVYIDDINSGVIMKSPNGQCWRVQVDDNGQLVPMAINFPD